MYPKTEFSSIGLTYVISIVQYFFLIFVQENILYFFFAEFESLMFHNNIVKISEKLNLLKTFPQVTYPTDFCTICIHFYYGEKVKIFDFLKTND